ncbi:MAG: hypothetical protein Q4A34_00475 [Candidatus Saccharibacteria bacterium]|nr:hypothetical protein [Candidatus Saccharibacteria bacterium]
MGILALENKQRGVIDVATVARVDGRRWLMAAVVLNASYSAVVGLVMAAGAGWQHAQWVIWGMNPAAVIALTLFGAAAAVGKLRSLQTVVVAATGLLFIQLAEMGSMLGSILPTHSLPATAGIISSLAIWRLIEYYDMLHNSGLEQPPRFTLGAWLWYGGFTIIPFLLVYF